VAAALGYLGVGSEVDLFAQTRAAGQGASRPGAVRASSDDWDSFAHLSSNENCWGPPESVMKAMNNAWKYSNRYGYPDGNIVQEIAKHHGVKTENILLTAGSGELLDVVGTTFLPAGKKVLGVEPSYSSVYQHATTIKSSAIKLPLGKDYRQDMPVLIDEAYHHFVDDPAYATSTPYVLEGRPVIIGRTFSKIAALAGMRLGYGISTPEIIQKMRPYSMGSINALVKWGGAAALKDTESQARIKKMVIDLRKKTTSELAAHGYEVIP